MTASTSRTRVVVIFAGLMVGLFISELNETIFSTALPTVVGELGGIDQMLWVGTAYVLAATISMPIYGRLSDQIGRKRVFLAGVVIFLVGSVIGGLAAAMGWLIAGRVVQGLGSGGLVILVQAIVADVIPARQRARYLSALGAVFALAALLGPVLGGWLTEGVGWRWAFWVNLPLGGVAVGLAAAFLPRSARRAAPVRIDWPGIASMAVAVSCLVLVTAWGGATYAWTSPVIIGLAVSGGAATTIFVVVERQVAEPLLPLGLFTVRNFTVPTIAGSVTAVATFGAVGYLPSYLQMVHGLSPTRSGLMMLTLITGLAATTVGSAQLVSRTGRYRWVPVIGSAVVALALTLLSTLTPDTALWVVGAYLFLFGAGIGGLVQILVLIAQNAVPARVVGTATAANNFFREIGVAVGSAAVGALFTSRLVDRLAGSAGAGLDPRTLTPERVAQLDAGARASIAAAYNAALTPVFGWLVPLMIISGLALALVRPLPLATSVPAPEPVDQPEFSR